MCYVCQNKCFGNNIGILQECKENEVCYYHKFEHRVSRSYYRWVDFIYRGCERREKQKMNNCGKYNDWLTEEV